MKNINRILSHFGNRPLLIQPNYLSSILNRWETIEVAAEISTALDWSDFIPQMEIKGGTAYVPIIGLISNHVPEIEQAILGIVDLRDTKRNVETALADPTVEQIVLDIDTGGGEAYATELFAPWLVEAGKIKPIYSFTADFMASAGYFIASSTKEIYANPFSRGIGYIGSIFEFWDMKNMFALAGIEVVQIKDGKFKGEGFPGTSLSDEYKQYISAEVKKSGEAFRNHVKTQRPNIVQADLDVALVLTAEEALNKGFIDGIVEAKEDIFVK